MTTPDRSAHEIVDALKDNLFRLYDRANQPDIVWTEDGPQWGDTYEDADSPEVLNAVAAAEEALDNALRTYRAELGDDPRWQSFYTALDNSEPDAASLDRGAPVDEWAYRVEVSHPATVTFTATLADAYQWASDHLASGRVEVPPAGRIMLEIYAHEADSPLLGGYDTPEHLAAEVRQQGYEHAAAQTLLSARSGVQQSHLIDEHPRTGAVTPAHTEKVDRLRELAQHRPIESLICQWAVEEVQRPTDAASNRWSLTMQMAGLHPQMIRLLADHMNPTDLTCAPLHPAVQQRDSILEEFLAHYTDRHLAEQTQQAGAPETEHIAPTHGQQSPTIRSLLDATQPPTAASPELTRGPVGPPVLENPSITAEPEIGL